MAAYDLPGADFIPGLTAQDYSLMQGVVGEEAGLLDYTPPNVQWQPPLVPLGENVFESFVKTHLDEPASWRLPSGETYTATPQTPWYPSLQGERQTGELDLLKEYNRRLSRPLGTPGSLPESGAYPGRPETMSEFGQRRFGELSDIDPEGTRLYPRAGEPPPLFQDIHQQPLRNPYIAYSGQGTVGMGEGAAGYMGGRLPQPSVSGYDYAYPIYSYYPNVHTDESFYQPGREGFENRMYLTKDIKKYPYFPTLPQDLAGGVKYDGQDYILVGQTLVPTGERDDIFSY
tara:strand:+ start:283 stop:1143 length:861 start_codon:yes stop_codon:yes gene_type:complete